MTIRRITLSVPDEMAKRIKKAAGSAPVSSWVANVIESHLDDAELDRLWAEFLRDVNPGAKDVRRADAIFKRLKKAASGGRAA